MDTNVKLGYVSEKMSPEGMCLTRCQDITEPGKQHIKIVWKRCPQLWKLFIDFLALRTQEKQFVGTDNQ
jgi:hypothetical protein